MALTSHLLSFFPPASFSTDRYGIRRQLSFHRFDRDAVFTLIELSQSLPNSGDELDFLCDVVERRIVRQEAQQVMNNFLVRHTESLRARFSPFKSVEAAR